MLSTETHASGDAWQLADRALALAERACGQIARRPHDPRLTHLANRALDLSLALFDRADHLQHTLDTHQEQPR